MMNPKETEGFSKSEMDLDWLFAENWGIWHICTLYHCVWPP
jgi:hypothetical protein